VHYEQCPQQADGISCGLFAVCNGLLIAMMSSHRAAIQSRQHVALVREAIGRTLVVVSRSDDILQSCTSHVPSNPEESKQMVIDLWRHVLSSVLPQQVSPPQCVCVYMCMCACVCVG